ncbi:MAG: hypothetical protein ACYTHM_11425 [Planctomycetota bacterium]|jgi:hypothetical protein
MAIARFGALLLLLAGGCVRSNPTDTDPVIPFPANMEAIRKVIEQLQDKNRHFPGTKMVDNEILTHITNAEVPEGICQEANVVFLLEKLDRKYISSLGNLKTITLLHDMSRHFAEFYANEGFQIYSRHIRDFRTSTSFGPKDRQPWKQYKLKLRYEYSGTFQSEGVKRIAGNHHNFEIRETVILRNQTVQGGIVRLTIGIFPEKDLASLSVFFVYFPAGFAAGETKMFDVIWEKEIEQEAE